MKKSIFMIKALLISSAFVFADTAVVSDINIVNGWQLKGSDAGFSTMQNFNQNCIDTVWSFDTSTQSWRAYSPDSGLATLIQNSASIANLSNINPNDGFWVKANSDCSVIKEGNISTVEPIVIYETDALWPYATPLTLDMVANKSFNTGYGELITFDTNGFADTSSDYMSSCQNSSFESNISLNDDGVLVREWMNTYINNDTNTTQSDYGKDESKLLASNESIGHVLVMRYYNDYNKQYYENVWSMIFDSAVENPIDMSTKLPYTTYNNWDLVNKSGRTYNSDYTITNFDKDGVNGSSENFSIEGGKITTSYDYNDSYSESHSVDSKQIVFEIGDYDILKYEYTGFNKNKQISYNDENNSWTTIDLNSSIVTFYDIFELTNNKLYDSIYNLETGTISNPYSSCNSETFSISGDGKTLTTCWSDANCYDRVLEDGAIVDNYNDSHYEVTKTTPYF